MDKTDAHFMACYVLFSEHLITCNVKSKVEIPPSVEKKQLFNMISVCSDSGSYLYRSMIIII